MAKVKRFQKFFKTVTKKCNGKSDDKLRPFLSSASVSVSQTEISIVCNEIKLYTQPRKNYNISIPERINNEVGEYALINGTKSALDKFGKKYPKYTFIRTSVNDWKKNIEKDKNDNNATVQRRQGKSNLLDDGFLVRVKDVVTGVRMAGGVISRKMVTAIVTGVISANCPSILKDFGGHILLTEGWARGVLKSMEWSKRKGTTGKIKPSKQFLLEEKLTFKIRNSSIIQEHDITKELLLNLDQTPLSYVSPGKYTFNPKGAKIVPR